MPRSRKRTSELWPLVSGLMVRNVITVDVESLEVLVLLDLH